MPCGTGSVGVCWGYSGVPWGTGGVLGCAGVPWAHWLWSVGGLSRLSGSGGPGCGRVTLPAPEPEGGEEPTAPRPPLGAVASGAHCGPGGGPPPGAGQEGAGAPAEGPPRPRPVTPSCAHGRLRGGGPSRAAWRRRSQPQAERPIQLWGALVSAPRGARPGGGRSQPARPQAGAPCPGARWPGGGTPRTALRLSYCRQRQGFRPRGTPGPHRASVRGTAATAGLGPRLGRCWAVARCPGPRVTPRDPTALPDSASFPDTPGVPWPVPGRLGARAGLRLPGDWPGAQASLREGEQPGLEGPRRA